MLTIHPPSLGGGAGVFWGAAAEKVLIQGRWKITVQECRLHGRATVGRYCGAGTAGQVLRMGQVLQSRYCGAGTMYRAGTTGKVLHMGQYCRAGTVGQVLEGRCYAAGATFGAGATGQVQMAPLPPLRGDLRIGSEPP